MTETSKEDPNSALPIMFILTAFFFAVIVWTFFYHAEMIYKICLVISIIVLIISTSVLILITEDWRYSFFDSNWRYKLALPWLFTLVCLIMIVISKSLLDANAVSKAHKTQDYLTFAYSEISIERATLGFKQFMGILLIIFCDLWCAFVSIYNYVQHRRGIYMSLSFFSGLNGKIAFIALLTGAILILS